MPEAEELLIDGARHAATALGRLWRRHHPLPPGSPVLCLPQARRRLELLVLAVLARPIALREAQAGAPTPLLRRLWQRARPAAATLAPLPGNDGSAIYLPPSLPHTHTREPDDYALLTLLQAMRVARGSVSQLPAIPGGLVLDLYLIAEAVAAEHALRKLMPGWRDRLATLRADAARQLAERRPRGRQEATVAALYGAFLRGGLPGDRVPCEGLPAAGLPSSGLPPAALPPAALPSAGFPPAGFPPAGFPSAGFPSASFPSASFPSASFPSASFPPAGFPPGNFPPGRHPPGSFPDGDLEAPPGTATPAAALDWAVAAASAIRRLAPGERYAPWLGDAVIGRLLAPEGRSTPWRGSASPAAAATPQEPADRRRSTALSRRPRVRAANDEDDPTPGVWMIQTTAPQPHAEDPFGLNRPEDRDADDDPQGSAESLAELTEARLVRTPSPSRDRFHGGDPPPRSEGSAADAASAAGVAYPEWDFQAGAYREQAVRVLEVPAAEGAADWAAPRLARHAGMLREMRRRLAAIRPQRSVRKGLSEGEEIDCDALVAERSERRAGRTPAGAIYQSRRPTARRLALLLLIDASASTDAAVDGRSRIIDVEKEAALVAASALQAAALPFAILAFSGEGPRGVRIGRIKGFTETWDESLASRLGGLEPDRYTRLGAALRHAARTLAGQPAEHRLLLLFSDGRPNDCDRYASRYGLEDARQAVAEISRQGMSPYCFTIDRDGGGYLPGIFGPGRYGIVQQPQHLPRVLIAWLRHAARQCCVG